MFSPSARSRIAGALLQSTMRSARYTRAQVHSIASIGQDAVRHDPDALEFYVLLDGHRAYLQYEKHANDMWLMHTVVPEVFNGKGVGKLLAKVILRIWI